MMRNDSAEGLWVVMYDRTRLVLETPNLHWESPKTLFAKLLGT